MEHRRNSINHKKHQENVPKALLKREKMQRTISIIPKTVVGTVCIENETKQYRCGAFFAAAKANIPIDSLFDLNEWMMKHTNK